MRTQPVVLPVFGLFWEVWIGGVEYALYAKLAKDPAVIDLYECALKQHRYGASFSADRQGL
jgi:hypothetical protein